MDNVWLTLRGVSSSIWSHPIDTEVRVLGRQSTGSIQLLHNSVSRKHAEIWRESDGEIRIRDTGSSNGTFVNGNRVTESPVFVGDALQLGLVVLDVTEKKAGEPGTDVVINRPTEHGETVAAIETLDMSMESLSEAQLRVLRLLLTGQSEKEIAEALFLSPHTVHSHVRQIYLYYDVNSRPALMAHFIRLSLPDVDGQ